MDRDQETPPIEEDTTAAPEEASFDPQEYDFLPRREGHEWGGDLVENEIREVHATLLEAEASAAVLGLRIGRRLRSLYNGFAELAKGYPTFAAFAKAVFNLAPQRTSDYLRLADAFADEHEARRIGLTRGLLGAQLLALVGVQTFAALEKHELTTESGETIFFPATRPKLKSAIRALKAKAVLGALPVRKRKRLESLNERWGRRVEGKSGLASVHVEFVPDEEGEPLVRFSGTVAPKDQPAFSRLLSTYIREEFGE